MKYAFPKDFVWGTATASYQIEGAVSEDGRGESIWDRFCQMPGHILNGDNGDEANDHYHLYREDVALMKRLGHTAYRFSVSWSRIMPTGRGEVNEKGIAFYSNLIDELLANGIEPYLTVYHWDLPQALQDIGGWQNDEIIQYYEAYCKVLFERFGGRVKKWTTFNEPLCVAILGNFVGEHAPGIRDLATALRVSYNLLRSHGAAVRLFRKMAVPGEIGITLNATPAKPASESQADKDAAHRQNGFGIRWYFDPLFKGAFPADIVQIFKEKGITLPDFRDQASICEPVDFVGLNYYNTSTVRDNQASWPIGVDYVRENLPKTDRGWPIDPDGLTNMLVLMKEDYGIQTIYVTENGAAYNDVVNMQGEVEDYNRIDYLRRHFIATHKAMQAGVNIKGYFIWSLYDNFEWAFGRYSRFGLVHEDFETHTRTPKKSAWWFKDVIENNGLD